MTYFLLCVFSLSKDSMREYWLQQDSL